MNSHSLDRGKAAPSTGKQLDIAFSRHASSRPQEQAPDFQQQAGSLRPSGMGHSPGAPTHSNSTNLRRRKAQAVGRVITPMEVPGPRLPEHSSSRSACPITPWVRLLQVLALHRALRERRPGTAMLSSFLVCSRAAGSGVRPSPAPKPERARGCAGSSPQPAAAVQQRGCAWAPAPAAPAAAATATGASHAQRADNAGTAWWPGQDWGACAAELLSARRHNQQPIRGASLPSLQHSPSPHVPPVPPLTITLTPEQPVLHPSCIPGKALQHPSLFKTRAQAVLQNADDPA